MINNTLPDKSGNPEVIATARKLFNKCAYSWRGFAEGIVQVVLFTVL